MKSIAAMLTSHGAEIMSEEPRRARQALGAAGYHPLVKTHRRVVSPVLTAFVERDEPRPVYVVLDLQLGGLADRRTERDMDCAGMAHLNAGPGISTLAEQDPSGVEERLAR